MRSASAPGSGSTRHDDLAALRELDRVPDQVREDLAQARRIRADRIGHRFGQPARELEPLALRALGEEREHLLDDLDEVAVDLLEADLAGLALREVEDVVDHAEQELARVPDGLGETALARRELGLEEEVGHPHHAVHRRADLVAHVREELRLRRARLLRAARVRERLLGRDRERGREARPAPREEDARDDRERERHRAGEHEVPARVRQRGALGGERRRDVQLEVAEPAHQPDEVGGRRVRAAPQHERRAARLGPEREPVAGEGLRGDQPADRLAARGERHLGQRVVGARAVEERALSLRPRLDRQAGLGPAGRDQAAVGAQERDRRRPRPLGQLAREELERCGVAQLECGAELRRAGHGPVAVGEAREVALEEAFRRAARPLQTRAGGGLEVASQRALLEGEDEPGRQCGDADQGEEQACEDGGAHRDVSSA